MASIQSRNCCVLQNDQDVHMFTLQQLYKETEYELFIDWFSMETTYPMKHYCVKPLAHNTSFASKPGTVLAVFCVYSCRSRVTTRM